MPPTHDVIVIGAGSAGLTAAGGLGRLGLRVALIEAGAMGGECLNTGCVPSKTLIAVSRRAQDIRDSTNLGIRAGVPDVEMAAVRRHVQATIAAIAPHDSEERFRAWGVEVIRGRARFVGPRRLDVDGRRMSAPRIVIATGSKPQIPPIPGLSDVPYLTNETLFNLETLPQQLIILGGGPIGLEMGQAFRRLGSMVKIIDQDRVLSGSDPDAVDLLTATLGSEGIEFHLNAKVARAWGRDGAIALKLTTGETMEGSHLLVATSRYVVPDDLALDLAGIKADENGIVVDRRRRTSARGVYAIGDCRRGPRFTHAAGYEGTRMVMEIGFGIPAPVHYRALSRVTYTDPELAEVGMTEDEARAAGGNIEIIRKDFVDNDRAVTESRPEGFLKLIRRNGKTVGVCIIGAGAAELLIPWILQIGGSRASLWGLTSAIVPYPTRAEISQAVAFSAFEAQIFSKWARSWAQAVARIRFWLN